MLELPTEEFAVLQRFSPSQASSKGLKGVRGHFGMKSGIARQ